MSPLKPRTAAHSLAIGNPSGGDLAIATAKLSRGAVYAVPERGFGSASVR